MMNTSLLILWDFNYSKIEWTNQDCEYLPRLAQNFEFLENLPDTVFPQIQDRVAIF